MRAAIQQNLSFDPITRRAHPDGLIRAKECAAAGLCIFCEEPVAKGRHRARVICEKHCCYLAYHRAYHRDSYRRLAATHQLTRTFRAIAENIEKLEQLAPQAPSNSVSRRSDPEEASG